MLFRLINGPHTCFDASGKEHEYRAGQQGNDLIESDVDLCKKFHNKFERVPDGDSLKRPSETGRQYAERLRKMAEAAERDEAANADSADTYEAMNEKELRHLAQTEEIDLKGCKTKNEIIAAIRNSKQLTHA